VRELLVGVEQALAGRPSKRDSPLDKVVANLYQGRNYFWIGIYLAVGNELVRQAFRGPAPPCHSFALGVGNVGTAGKTGIMKVVPDVSRDPTYSQCFLETKSELVAPIRMATRVLGVIDVESDRLNAFGGEDRVLLQAVAVRLARFLTGRGKLLVRRARESAAREAAAAASSAGVAAHRPPRSERLAARGPSNFAANARRC